MNGEDDAFETLSKRKGDVRLRGNGDKYHKNGAENGDLGGKSVEEFQQTPIWIAVMTYIAYAILILFGYLRDFMRYYGLEKSRAFKEIGNKVSNAIFYCSCFVIAKCRPWACLHTSSFKIVT